MGQSTKKQTRAAPSTRRRRKPRSKTRAPKAKGLAAAFAAIVNGISEVRGRLGQLRSAAMRAEARRVLSAAAKGLTALLAAERRADRAATAKAATSRTERVKRKARPAVVRAKTKTEPAAKVEVEVEVTTGYDDEDDEEDTLAAVPSSSKWRGYILQRIPGDTGPSAVQAIQLYERRDRGTDPEDPDYRMWFLDILVNAPWSMLEGSLEGTAVRVTFPVGDDGYYGLPPFLDLEKPLQPRLGASWRLRAPTIGTVGQFSLREVIELSADQLIAREHALEDLH